MFSALTLLWFVTANFESTVAQQRIVNIESGRVRGLLLSTIERRPYSGFIGIPYAQPPTRFMLPQRPGIWTGVRDATRYQPACPQLDPILNRVIGNEDCLYLNVYTPTDDPSNGINLVSYPVIVFIHGPDYSSSSGNVYGPERLIDKNNVVVTFNHRLGSLGFLSTADSASPGNYGLHDQLLALEWVRRNIAQFRGDPNRITLAGQGAGAACVSLHMLSPLSRGLFRRAITESGNALCRWAVDETPREISAVYAQKMGRILECGTGLIETSFLVGCLRKRLVTDIIRAQEQLKGFGSFPGVWKPVVDGTAQLNQSRAFLPTSPQNLMAQGIITGDDLITGVNQNDGSLLYYYLMKFQPNIALDDMFLQNNLLPSFLGNLTNFFGPNVVQKVMNDYFRNINLRNPSQVIQSFTQMATDAMFVGCNDEWAKKHASTRSFSQNNLGNAFNDPKTYMYVFSYANRLNSFVDLEKGAFSGLKLFDTGVSNRDELIYLWNLGSYNFTRFNLLDRAISNRMTILWSRFVANGDPVPFIDGEFRPWSQFEANVPNYYEIGRTLADKVSYRQQQSILWTETLKSMTTTRPTSTYPTNIPFVKERLTDPCRYKTATFAMIAVTIALVILCIFLCVLLTASRRKREFKAEPDVYH